jgi:hypothetical protein
MKSIGCDFEIVKKYLLRLEISVELADINDIHANTHRRNEE